MTSIWGWSYVLGPLVLLIVGIMVQYLQARGHKFGQEVFFFSNELALSNLGSVLSAFVVSSKSMDVPKLTALIVLSVGGVVILLLVATLNKRLRPLKTRPKLRFFMLAVFANLIGVGALSTTLYYTSFPMVEKVITESEKKG